MHLYTIPYTIMDHKPPLDLIFFVFKKHYLYVSKMKTCVRTDDKFRMTSVNTVWTLTDILNNIGHYAPVNLTKQLCTFLTCLQCVFLTQSI